MNPANFNINNCLNCKSSNCLFKRNLTEDNLKVLSANKRAIVYNRGETIIKYGNFESNIYMISQGLVKTIVEGGNNRQAIYKLTPSGEIVNFSALLANKDYYPYSVVAMKRTTVCAIKLEFVRHLLETNSSLTYELLEEDGKEFTRLISSVKALATTQTPGRMAQMLLKLFEKNMQQEDVFEHISRKEMAELAGMSFDSAMKLLNELKNDKIIDIKNKHIQVNDWEMLKRLAKVG